VVAQINRQVIDFRGRGYLMEHRAYHPAMVCPVIDHMKHNLSWGHDSAASPYEFELNRPIPTIAGLAALGKPEIPLICGSNRRVKVWAGRRRLAVPRRIGVTAAFQMMPENLIDHVHVIQGMEHVRPARGTGPDCFLVGDAQNGTEDLFVCPRLVAQKHLEVRLE
jgi:hypothetical protein